MIFHNEVYHGRGRRMVRVKFLIEIYSINVFGIKCLYLALINLSPIYAKEDFTCF